jgi:hypothetical protein
MVLEARDNASRVFQQLDELAAKSGKSASGAFERFQNVSDRVNGSIAQLGIGVAGAFELKNLAEASDAFERMRIISGKSREEIEKYKDTIFETAIAWRVSSDELENAMRGVKNTGGSMEFFEQNAKGIAATLQLLGGDNGQAIGETYQGLHKSLAIQSGNELDKAVSAIDAKLKGVGGSAALETFVPALGQLGTSYQATTSRTGLPAAEDLGNVAALIYSGARNKREAVSQTDTFFNMFRDPNSHLVQKLMQLGATPAQRPMTDVIMDVGRYYNRSRQAKARVTQLLGPDFIDPLLPAFNEMKDPKNHGRSPTLDHIMSLHADLGRDQRNARDLGASWGGTLNAVTAAVDRLGDKAASAASPILKLVGANADLAAGAGATLAGIYAFGAGVRLLAWGLGPLAFIFSAGSWLTGAAAISEFAPLAGEGMLGIGAALEAFPIAAALAIPAAIAAIGYGIWKIYENRDKPWLEQAGGISGLLAGSGYGGAAAAAGAKGSDQAADSNEAPGDTSVEHGAEGAGKGRPKRSEHASAEPGALGDTLAAHAADIAKIARAAQAPAAQLSHEFTFKFEGLPPGVTLRPVRNGTTVDISTGPAMTLP